jgi:hypothetical protein
MLKLLLIIIILYIIIQQLLDYNTLEEPVEIKSLNNTDLNNKISSSDNYLTKYEHVGVNNTNGQVQVYNPPQILNTATKNIQKQVSFAPIKNSLVQKSKSESDPDPDPDQKVWDFNVPNPWTKIVYNMNDDYPYHFYIKLTIPSLNDYQTWKQIIPNLNFNSRTGELIIPSKDEPSALALANLIVINMTGQLSLENILNKNLIQISTAKSRKYEIVQNKLREQIKENLNKKINLNIPDIFEKDLAKIDISKNNITSDKFNDTFKHFSDELDNTNNTEIGAYDGSDFSYL